MQTTSNDRSPKGSNFREGDDSLPRAVFGSKNLSQIRLHSLNFFSQQFLSRPE